MKARKMMLSKGSIMESANSPDEIADPYSKIKGTNRTKIPLKISEGMEIIQKNPKKLH